MKNLSQFFLVVATLLLFSPYGHSQKKIVGGTDVVPGAYPWMCALVDRNVSNTFNAQFCGGSLVHESWVLTAAHCVDDRSAGSLGVWIDINDLNDTSGGVYRNVKAVFIHPSYEEDANGFLYNDIALLLLETPVTTVAPAEYARTAPGTNDTVQAVGWGQTESNPAFPSILQEVSLQILPLPLAQSSYGNSLGTEHIAATGPGSDTCQGDSGGPLFDSSGFFSERVYGITSFGVGCADGPPGIYTNVALFASWIDAFLAQPTDVDPDLSFKSGPYDLVQNGSPSRILQTHWGRRLRGGKAKGKTYTITNATGSSPASIISANAKGRSFRIAGTPPYIFGGSTSTIRVRFRAPNRRKVNRGTIRIFSTDPDTPLFSFKVLAKSKPKKRGGRRGGTGFF